MGAAEDGRAPTEERACMKGWGFCSTGLLIRIPFSLADNQFNYSHQFL